MMIVVDTPERPLEQVIEDMTGKIWTVFLNPAEGRSRHNFRCMNCGKLLYQYSGGVQTMVMGGIDTINKATLDLQCHRCHLVYRFLW